MSISDLPLIAAIVAAAGFSRRMGHFKQLLPWGDSSVIRAVVDNLHDAGADPILCVTGHRADEVAAALAGSPAQIVHNQNFSIGEMLTSYQAGISAIRNSQFAIHNSQFPGALLSLADQPHIPAATIRHVIDRARSTPGQIIIPSHQMRRGHPIYLPRHLWPELLALSPDASLRDLLNCHASEIVYVDVDTDAIRQDMDEWGEYERLRGEFDDKQFGNKQKG